MDNLETKVAIWGGQVLRQGNGPLDVYRTGVDLAARLLAVAKPSELLVSEDLVQLALSRLSKVKDCQIGNPETSITKEGRIEVSTVAATQMVKDALTRRGYLNKPASGLASFDALADRGFARGKRLRSTTCPRDSPQFPSGQKR